MPIGPASRHIWQLRRAGLSTNTIAASAGLPMPTVDGIAAGRRAQMLDGYRSGTAVAQLRQVAKVPASA